MHIAFAPAGGRARSNLRATEGLRQPASCRTYNAALRIQDSGRARRRRADSLRFQQCEMKMIISRKVLATLLDTAGEPVGRNPWAETDRFAADGKSWVGPAMCA